MQSSPTSSPSGISSHKPYSSSPASKQDNIFSKNTSPDTSTSTNASVVTPDTSISSSLSTIEEQKRLVAEVIADAFPPFDHHGVVVGPYENEQKRDIAFREELAERVLSLTLKLHAWASSRPIHQSERRVHGLEKDINDVIAIEGEQGESSDLCPPPSLLPRDSIASSLMAQQLSFAEQSRESLRNFVERIKAALAALVSLSSP